MLRGSPFETIQPVEKLELGAVRLLAPALPTKIVAVGLNFDDHILEMGYPKPEEPLIFLKAPSALNGPEEPIRLPKQSKQVEFEGELALVILKTCKDVPEARVYENILGYSCFNDVSARDLQRKDGQFARAKSFDSFACLGPWIETELAPDRLKIETYLNGELKQSSNTAHLLFGVPKLVSFVSEVMTLYPGDIITSGTPSGVGPLRSGDLVEVRIEGIGALRNPVI